MKVLLTGGASGLGEAITRALASHAGWKIYFTYCHSSENAKQIQSEFSNTVPFRCDFNKASDVSALCKQLEEWELDVLIHNAYNGTYIDAHFHKTDLQRFQKDFETNILPVVELTQAAIRHFRDQKRGRIITVLSSALLHTPSIGSSVYLAGKAYLATLTKLWAVENEKFNIRSISVAPDFMETSLTGAMDDRLLEQLRAQQPLGRFLTTQEVAEVISHLSSTDQIINGQMLEVQAGPQIKAV